MKRIVTAITTAAAIALATILPARAAFPALTLIYRVPGVIDSGSAIDVGVATAVQCTNVSGVAITLRVVSVHLDGSVAGTATVTVANGHTVSLSTHFTNPYGNEVTAISAGIGINAGSIRILATRAAVFCNASVIDASATLPNGIDLHMVRYNAAPGTVE